MEQSEQVCLAGSETTVEKSEQETDYAALPAH